jgi:hypothetical protein
MADIENTAIPAVERLNSMAEQQFPTAERQLASLGSKLLQAERAAQAVVSRLAEVRTVESTLPEALRLTQGDLDRAAAFRDRENPKISPSVDAQLQTAQRQLETASDLAERREYLAAGVAQAEARRQAIDALASASEQVKRINALQAEVGDSKPNVEQLIAAIDSDVKTLPPYVLTAATTDRLGALTARAGDATQLWLALGAKEDDALEAGLRNARTLFAETMALAEEVQSQLAADRHSFAQLQQEAETAIRQAEQTVAAARSLVNHGDAGGASRHALERARLALPDRGELVNATRLQLADLAARANLAGSAAQDAQRAAEEDIRRARRRRQPVWVSTGGYSPSFGGSSARTSRRSQSRGSQRPSSSSRRSGGSSSSRRSSSIGSSRRSSSSGGSRRR